MTPSLRMGGFPSPLADGTHDDGSLRPTIPFDPAAVEVTGDVLVTGELAVDPFILPDAKDMPGWLTSATRMIRPICVGALMAIPTVGAATVGAVAMVDGPAAMRAVEASTAFLVGIPGDIVLLIGALATGYSLSKTVERIKGKRV